MSTTSLPETTKVIYMGSDPVYDRYPYPATDRYDPSFVFRVDPMNALTALSTALDSQTDDQFPQPYQTGLRRGLLCITSKALQTPQL